MFRIVRMTAFAVVWGLAALAAAQNAASTLLMNAVAATQAAKADYAFDFELETSKQNWRARFDPSANPRLHLVQPRRDELSGDERRAYDRLAGQMEGVSWCASENMGRVGDLRLVREDDASAVYAFQPTAESIRGEQARRFANRLRGEVTLTKATPDVMRIRVYAPQPFSPLPLVRVDHVNIVIACQTAPNGRRYAAETATHIAGSAVGQRIDERSIQRVRNLSAP
jgi:hypothetical protein